MLTVNYKTSRDYIMSIFEIRNLNVRYTTPAHDEESILSVSDKTRLRKINNKPFYFQRDKASTTTRRHVVKNSSMYDEMHSIYRSS